MIVPQNVINQIHRVEFSLFEPLSTTTLWAYPVGQSYDYRIFLSGQWTSVADDAGGSLSGLIQRAELAIKAAISATEGAENVNATLIGNTLTVTDREGKTTSITLSGTGGGGYEPPADGIPKTDLAVDVQTSLGKADTALQSFMESDPVFGASAAAGITSSDITNWNGKTSNIGTITGITMNGSSKGTSGVVDLGTVITSHQDISGKADKATTLSGYGITDAKIDNGVITLGNNTITPLTSFTETDPTVPSWAKQSSKPSYSYSEITDKPTLATVATSGSYNDLSNKPTIPDAQIQSDWNQNNSSAKDFIQNKPDNLAYIDSTQGSATTASFDPQTDTVWTKTQTLSVASKTTARNNIGAQEALVSGTNIKTINNESLLDSGNITVVTELPSNTAYLSNDNGDGIVPDDGIRSVTVTSAAAMTINPDVVTVIDGEVGASVFTLQVPNDNLAHVWDILFTSAASGIPSFVMSDSSSIKYPSGYSIGASKAVEISVIGVGTKYYLRYGEFA